MEFSVAALVICQPVEASFSRSKRCFLLIRLWFRAGTMKEPSELLFLDPRWDEREIAQQFVRAEAIAILQLKKKGWNRSALLKWCGKWEILKAYMPQRIHTNFSRAGNVCDGDMGMVHGMVFIAEEKFASEAKDTSSSLKQSPFLLFFFSSCSWVHHSKKQRWLSKRRYGQPHLLLPAIISGLARCFIYSVSCSPAKALVFLTLSADFYLRRHGLCHGLDEADVYLDKKIVNMTHLFCSVSILMHCVFCESWANFWSKS